jgi:hypothetical protein
MNLFNIKKTFEMKAAKKWPEVYFCIDLHGTIIPSGKSAQDRQDILEFYPYAKEVLQWLTKREDIILILWTSTPAERLSYVLKFLESNDIVFQYFNNNTHAKSTPRSDFERKFYFSVLLDDRSSFDPKHDWILVARQLEKSTGEKILEWNIEQKLSLDCSIAKTIKNLTDIIEN